MELWQLRTFHGGRDLNFTRAGKQLNLTQSVSHQIKALEKELGEPLFIARNVASGCQPGRGWNMRS